MLYTTEEAKRIMDIVLGNIEVRGGSVSFPNEDAYDYVQDCVEDEIIKLCNEHVDDGNWIIGWPQV